MRTASMKHQEESRQAKRERERGEERGPVGVGRRDDAWLTA